MWYHTVRKKWKVLFCIVVPLLLSPLLLIDGGQDDSGNPSNKFRCLYVILLMGFSWMFEALPLPVTAILPVALFPLLGIQSTSSVAPNYMRETGMMTFGGIALALGIEHSGLDKRIALNMMLFIGTSPYRILLGIMVSTFIISCFIVGSTAVAAMLIPIVLGLVEGDDHGLRKLYMLALGYSANIGGTAVMIGSTPNIVFKDLISAENIGQNGKYTEVNFANWIAFNMPIALINLFLVWGYLGYFYLRKTNTNLEYHADLDLPDSRYSISSSDSIPSFAKVGGIAQGSSRVGVTLREKLEELGPMNFQEKTVSVLFSFAVVLWATRDPQIFPGWLDLILPSGKIVVGDSTVAIIILVFLFIIPRSWDTEDTLLNWTFLQSKFPWSVILLVGGGFAISDGASVSGLSDWIGTQMNGFESLPPAVLLLTVLLTISLFTEIMSNNAAVSLLTPILLSLSEKLGLHPLYLTFAGAIATQYAFILPTSNSSNALVFAAGNMKILDMASPGLPLNFVCLAVLYLMNMSWGQVLFNFGDYEYSNITDTGSLSQVFN